MSSFVRYLSVFISPSQRQLKFAIWFRFPNSIMTCTKAVNLFFLENAFVARPSGYSLQALV